MSYRVYKITDNLIRITSDEKVVKDVWIGKKGDILPKSDKLTGFERECVEDFVKGGK